MSSARNGFFSIGGKVPFLMPVTSLERGGSYSCRACFSLVKVYGLLFGIGEIITTALTCTESSAHRVEWVHTLGDLK